MEITENSMKLRRQYVAPQILEIVELSDDPLLTQSKPEISDLDGYDSSEEDTEGFKAKASGTWDDDSSYNW